MDQRSSHPLGNWLPWAVLVTCVGLSGLTGWRLYRDALRVNEGVVRAVIGEHPGDAREKRA